MTILSVHLGRDERKKAYIWMPGVAAPAESLNSWHMKDYRQVYRFCVIRGVFTLGKVSSGQQTWSIVEEEEAYQSREIAHTAFRQARDTFAAEADGVGKKARKADLVYWYCLDRDALREFHYVRYDEVPIPNARPAQDDGPFALSPERILERGTCFVRDNVRHEHREVGADPQGSDECIAEGSARTPDRPMAFTRRHSAFWAAELRNLLESAEMDRYLGGFYPDELRDVLLRKAVRMESTRKLFTLALKAWKQGVGSFTVLADSEWLTGEYNEWSHYCGWDPYNNDLPNYLADSLNYHFLKDSGRIENYDIRSFAQYRRLCDRCREDSMLLGDLADPEAFLEDPYVTDVEITACWESGFPLKLDISFDTFFMEERPDNADVTEETYGELSSAYDAYAYYLRSADR